MADLQTNLQRLENNSDEISSLVTDISDAIIAKGGTLPSNAGLRSFPAAIAAIPDTSNIATKTDTTGSVIKFIGDGNPLIRCDIEGNMNQQGTPSPSSIIIPSETGDKTENLFDKNNYIDINAYITSTSVIVSNGVKSLLIPCEPNTTYTVSRQFRSKRFYLGFITTSQVTTNMPVSNVVADNGAMSLTSTSAADSQYMILFYAKTEGTDSNTPEEIAQLINGLMAVAGETAPDHYIPYGYKISISSGGVTTPVYLGEVQSTRQIKKVVIDGTESNWLEWNNLNLFRLSDMSRDYKSQQDGAICDSLPLVARGDLTTNTFCWSVGTIGEFIININNYNLADLKTYLNSNPITIWYVLATPETGIVNEPIRKIGDYADSVSVTGIPTVSGLTEFQVTTTLPPSKTTIEYRYIENIPTLDSKTITTNGTYNASDDNLDGYSSVTVNVSSGTGGSDVIFYDYDGTVVTSYSAADFANLSAMPNNPTHTGLTAQGWNWSLADAKAYVASYGKLNIGQMYITSDGKTRLYFTVTKSNLLVDLSLDLESDTELDIDWGDGSEHTRWTSDDYSKSHEYASAGRYVITIEVITGGFNLSSPLSNIYKIEIGNNVTNIGEWAFYQCTSLSSITIPNSVTSINDAFYQCTSLSFITIPDGVTSISGGAFDTCYALSSAAIPASVTDIGYGAFQNCTSLSSITIPDSVTSISDSAFQSCSALSSITIPDSVTSIGAYAFYYCYSLSSITIPDGVTSIGEYTFQYCHPLSSVTIPNSVTSISSSAFDSCYALSSITFESSTPPNLDGTFGIPDTCIIRVPQGSLSDYTSASNYPDPSQYIYEEY